MKKHLFSLLFILTTLFISVTTFNASNASIKVTSTSSNVLTGKTIDVTITTTSTDNLGVIEYTLSYDTKILKLTDSPSTCSSSYCTWYTTTENNKTQKFNFKFKAIGSGTTKIDVTDVRVVGFDEKAMAFTTTPANIKTITEEELEASYSSNNYLSSLSVKGYNLSPTFSKDVTKYTLELDETVEKIKIIATVEDNKSTLTGNGTKKVSEGENKLKVVVTAENGSKKTYTILATVKSLNPIKVNVDDIEYTLIKKASALPTIENYTLTEIEISDTKIPSYTSDITNYTIVGLKDSEGNTKLCIYDIYNEKYTEYIEFKFDNTSLQILDNDKNIPEGYKKTTITINNTTVTAYKDSNDSDFALIYGMNTLTGKKGFYKYDSAENTIQRFNERKVEKKIINNITEEDNINMYLVIGIGILAFILLIIVTTALFKQKPKRRK